MFHWPDTWHDHTELVTFILPLPWPACCPSRWSYQPYPLIPSQARTPAIPHLYLWPAALESQEACTPSTLLRPAMDTSSQLVLPGSLVAGDLPFLLNSTAFHWLILSDALKNTALWAIYNSWTVKINPGKYLGKWPDRCQAAHHPQQQLPRHQHLPAQPRHGVSSHLGLTGAARVLFVPASCPFASGF